MTKRLSLLEQADKKELECLFQQMADSTESRVTLVKWERSGCIVAIGISSDPYLARLRIVGQIWKGYPFPADAAVCQMSVCVQTLVKKGKKYEEVGPAVYVSPIPSAVLAIILRK